MDKFVPCPATRTSGGRRWINRRPYLLTHHTALGLESEDHRLCQTESGPRIKSEGGTVGGVVAGAGEGPSTLRLWCDLRMDPGSRPG